MNFHSDYFREPGQGFNMAVDGSVTPVVFSLAPALDPSQNTGQVMRRLTLSFQLVDNVSPFNPLGFGALPALANGILLQGRRDQVVRSLTGGVPIKTNADFAILGDVVNEQTDGTRTAVSVTIHSLFDIEIRAAAQESLEVVILDDLSSLTALRMLAYFDRYNEHFPNSGEELK